MHAVATTKGGVAQGERGRCIDEGSGAVLRDHHGVFLEGTSHFPPGITDPERAELLACRRALQLATDFGVQKLILEMDSQTTVRKITMDMTGLSANGPIVHEVKELFNKICVANKAAHVFAREGCSNKICKTWFQVPPEFCSSMATSECVVNYIIKVAIQIQTKERFIFP